MIRSFADRLTEKVFLGENLRKKEQSRFGSLTFDRVRERLHILDDADERDLLLQPALHYHKLGGTKRYSIDADSRHSPWRITFQWDSDEMIDVELVMIEDTH